jgi:hypothetical protein
MSRATVNLCDVQNCGKVATHTLKYVTVANFNINQERMDTSDGRHIWTQKDVDMCNLHEHQYRSNLPSMKLNQMKEVTG